MSNSTTTEWTAESLENEREHIGWQALAERINAEIQQSLSDARKTPEYEEEGRELMAAEWAADDRKWNTQEVVERNLIAFTNAALATEREKLEDMTREQIAAGEAADSLREQLAAEREKVKKWEDESDRRDVDEADYRQKMVAEIQARDKQLAAKRDWIAKFCGYDEKAALDAYVATQLAAERENLATVRELRELDQQELRRANAGCTKLREQLDAEREYGSAVTGASISAEDVIQQLKQQLAAICKNGEIAINRGIEIQQLQEQLAAEREKVKKAQEEAFAAYAEVDAIREQLAAAVEALKSCRQGFIAWNDPQHTNLIDAALEKVTKSIKK